MVAVEHWKEKLVQYSASDFDVTAADQDEILDVLEDVFYHAQHQDPVLPDQATLVGYLAIAHVAPYDTEQLAPDRLLP